MREFSVVSHFRKFLSDQGWTLPQVIPSANVGKTNYGYIPDILAHKGDDILVGEAKGSEGLRELQTAIGQATTYYNYGGNIIVIVVPEELRLVASNLLKNVCFEKSGKVGLFAVGNSGKVQEEIAYKRIRLTPEQAKRGRARIGHLTFIRDLRLEELRRLVEQMYTLKKACYSGKELFSALGKRNRDTIFQGRKTKGSLTEKSFTNALITTNSLGLTENGGLTSLGISLALEKDEAFDLRLIKLLLLNGNFIYFLREWEALRQDQEEPPPLSHDLLKNIVVALDKKDLLKESVKNIDDYVRRLRSNQIAWLMELGVVEQADNKHRINWTLVCDALTK